MTEENTQQDHGTEEAAGTTTGPTVIPATNLSAEAMEELRTSITSTYNFKVDVKPVKFNFKKSKDKDTGLESVRESVELAVPYPSIEGIVAIIEAGDKQMELLMDAMGDVINAQARDIISEDVKINATNFPVDKLSWEAIANMPKAQRRGGGISKETWEEFAQDYVEVMPAATGKDVEQVTNMARILTNKLANVKTNEPVLNMVIEQLAIYADNSPNVGEYVECVEFLLKKADTFLNVSPEDLLANL